jgi:hypothetical protein
VYAYALLLTFASNLFSKSTKPTNFIICTHVACVSAYKFCEQQLNQLHTGHTACQNVPKKAFPLVIFFSGTKSGVEKLNTVLES